MPDFWVNGIVSNRDKQPYVQLSNEKGMIAQLSMAQCRQIAMDMLVMCSRTEADAMIFKFFEKLEFPDQAAAAMMQEFRDFRAGLDDEAVEHTHRGEVDDRPLRERVKVGSKVMLNSSAPAWTHGIEFTVTAVEAWGVKCEWEERPGLTAPINAKWEWIASVNN